MMDCAAAVCVQRRTALASINPPSTNTQSTGAGGDSGSTTTTTSSFNDPSGNYSSTGASGLFPTSYDNASKVMMQDLSYEVQKKLKNAFYDPINKRCTLCNETLILPYNVHCNYIMHATRQAVLERVLSGIQGPPELVPQLWWSRLNDGQRGYGRLRYLSHNSKAQRRRRIIFILHFLLKRGIIRESLGIFKSGGGGASSSVDTVSSSTSSAVSTGFSDSAGPGSASGGTMSFSASSYNFQRHEMVGDSVVKYLLPDRIASMFPVSEGGVEGTAGQVGIGRIANLQHVIDSNEGLLKVYDYLDLDHMIGFRLPNSKTKSDVVESLFGELQGFLWAMDVELGSQGGSYTLQFPLSTEYRYVYSLVDHLINEIAHSVLIWAAESALETASEFVRENYKAPEDRMGKRYANNNNNRSGSEGPPPPSVPPPPFYTVRTSLLNRMPTPKEKAQKLAQSQYPPPQNLPAPYLSRVGASGASGYKRKPPAFLSGPPVLRVLRNKEKGGDSLSALDSYRKQMQEWYEHNKLGEEIRRSAQAGGDPEVESFYRVLESACAASSSANNSSSNRDADGDLMSEMSRKDEEFERYFTTLRQQGKQLGVKGFEEIEPVGATENHTTGGKVGGAASSESLKLRRQEIVASGMKSQLLQSYRLCAEPSELPVDAWLATMTDALVVEDNSLATGPPLADVPHAETDALKMALLKTGIVLECEDDDFVVSQPHLTGK